MSRCSYTLLLSFLILGKASTVRSVLSQSYQSTSIINVPLTIQVAYNSSSDNSTSSSTNKSYFLTCPRGSDAYATAPTIYDTAGELVWFGSDFGDCFDLNVQYYNGQTVLTVWNGTDNSAGYGNGMGRIVDSTYTTIATVACDSDTNSDLHEFNIPEDTNTTAIMTTYYPIQWDLSSVGGPTEGWMLTSGFQEINIADGGVVFNWSAADHMDLTESYNTINSTGGSEDDTWDPFHINSITKDAEGDYLVSSRHYHQILKVSATTGEVLWTLGGMTSNFTLDDESTFYWQHHARWYDDYTKISIFDNGATNWNVAEASARGITLEIDQDAMTTTLVNEYLPIDTVQNYSCSQGSIQILDDGNVVVGYGSNPWIGEYTSDGTVIFFATLGKDGEENNSPMQNYRVFKVSNWVGTPATSPDIAISGAQDDLTIYVSWNGATEVSSYAYYTSTSSSSSVTSTLNITRSGFETSWTDNSTSPSYIRVAALASNGSVLGWTDTITVDGSGTSDASGTNSTDSSSGSTSTSGAMSLVAGLSLTGVGTVVVTATGGAVAVVGIVIGELSYWLDELLGDLLL